MVVNMFLVNMGGKYELVLATHYFFLEKFSCDPLNLIKAFNKRVAAEVFLRKWGVGDLHNKQCLAWWIARRIACYNCVGSRKLTASELCRCPNLSYNEDVLRERRLA